MKRFFKGIITWLRNVCHVGRIVKELDAALLELSTLREAVIEFAAQKEEFEAQIAKYKKQVKDLRAKEKQTSEE